jgi:small subunit ribosomal protein S2
MKDYIFGARNGIYIIDLQKTVGKLRDALAFVSDLAASGGHRALRGHQASGQEVIAEEAARCGMYFVNQRWLGGTLTNFATIRKSLSRLRDLEEIAGRRARGDEEGRRRSWRRSACAWRRRSPASRRWTGCPRRSSSWIPTPRRSPVAEANKLGHPGGGRGGHQLRSRAHRLPIPGNDDAIRAIKLFAGLVATPSRRAGRSGKRACATVRRRPRSAPRPVPRTWRSGCGRARRGGEKLRAQAKATVRPGRARREEPGEAVPVAAEDGASD